MFKTFHGNKKPYIIRLVLAVICFSIAIFVFLTNIKPAAIIMSFNLGPALSKLFVDFSIITLIIVVFNLAAAFVFGRFYCSVFCPFGILQDFIGWIFRRKTGKTKNFPYIRYTIFAFCFAAMITGTTAVLRFFDPYSNFGNIITGFADIKHLTAYVWLPLLVITALVLWKNRIFCTTICPVGTLLGIFSKYGYNKLYISKDICKGCGQCEKECPAGAIDSKQKTLDNERCTRCLRCVAKCPGKGILFGHIKEEVKFEPSRRSFITAGIAAAAAIAVLAKGKDIAKNIVENLKKRPICPPGAGSVDEFTQKCTNCGLCVEHCKGKVLKKPDAEYETVHIDFSKGKCEFDCKNCSDVCPTGAIKKLSLKEKQNCRIGLVKMDKETCSKCGLCAHICPKGAIEARPGQVPVYLPQKCIGCGACMQICPTHSIEIVSINKQTQI